MRFLVVPCIFQAAKEYLKEKTPAKITLSLTHKPTGESRFSSVPNFMIAL